MEGNFGYSREYFDRFVQSQDSSVVNKFQQKYWKTKQTFIRVTGKKEDEHVVASDANLDAKLEVFHSIQKTCMELLKVIEQYQRRICLLSQEENDLGRFLRSQGSQDKSRAGKIMQASGKALCFSSQQRMALRTPLCRLYQEVETFRYRAISDTWLTVSRMEQSRTEYRGALLWMKDVSQELDPDTQKQMEKFRKVQAQVRSTKASFDKLKNDVCQKVDLLGASRCNLLSHVLTTYQTTLLHFWEKTSRNMAAIHESFRPSELPPLKDTQEVTGRSAQEEARKEGEAGSKEEEEAADELLFSLSNGESCDKPEQEEEEKDNLALLSEILGSLSTDEDSFSQEWMEVFGDEGASSASSGPPKRSFLPSQLLDQSLSSSTDWNDLIPKPVAQATPSGAGQSSSKAKEAAAVTTDRSPWFNLFADLDPLSNPDAVGRASGEHDLHMA